MQAKATKQSVASAIAKLEETGQAVTADGVRAITEGSKGTVVKYMKELREEGQKAQAIEYELSKNIENSILGFAHDIVEEKTTQKTVEGELEITKRFIII